MPIALIAAAVGAVGTIGSAVVNAGTASANRRTAQHIADQNNALSQQQYDTTKGFATPYIDAGTHANTALEGFLGIGGDAAASQKALHDYLGSTGYQFTRSQGIDAAETSAAAKGLLNSGEALKALDSYGTGLADQYGQQYVENLGTVANRGTAALGTLSTAGNSNVTNQTTNNNNAGQAAITANNQTAGAIGSGINAITGLGAKFLGASSFGGGGGSSAAAFQNAFNIGG
jgi:hypothetical protein